MEAPGPLRAVRSWEEALPDRGNDRDVHEAMLLTAGELGYGKATVSEVAARAHIPEGRFKRRFGDRDVCFARAYAESAERLGADLHSAAGDTADWHGAFEAALAELLRFVAEQPVLAKALLIEVKAARGEAWAKHQELVEQATEALETAREEPGGRPSASPMTAGFVVGAIEESLCIEIASGRGAEVERLLPDLTRLAFLQLFGEETSRESVSQPSRP